MKTHVMGRKVIERYYIDGLDPHGKVKRGVKPKLVLDEDESYVEFVEMFTYEDAPQSEGLGLHQSIHISEKEIVKIIREYFRADIGDWYQEVDKVVDLDSDENTMRTAYYDRVMKEWNDMMICGDAAVKEYCDIHNLKYEDTDYEKIRDLVNIPKNNGCFKDDSWLDIVGRYPLP